MKASDYEIVIDQIIDFDMEVSSLADCRRAMADLNEREEVLTQIRDGIKKDMRNVESDYLKRRTLIRNKYSKGSGMLNSFKGPFAQTRVKEMKKLENERKKSIEKYYEIKYVVDDLLVQIEEIQDNVKSMMKEMLGNF